MDNCICLLVFMPFEIKYVKVTCELQCEFYKWIFKNEVLWFHKRLNIELPYNPSFPVPEIYTKELKTDIQINVYTCIPRNTYIHSQKVEQMSFYRWIGKQTKEYYSAIKMEWNTNAYYNVDSIMLMEKNPAIC